MKCGTIYFNFVCLDRGLTSQAFHFSLNQNPFIHIFLEKIIFYGQIEMNSWLNNSVVDPREGKIKGARCLHS